MNKLRYENKLFFQIVQIVYIWLVLIMDNFRRQNFGFLWILFYINWL